QSLMREVSRRRCLILTYDDGPGLLLTPRVLDVLASSDAMATFFPLGREIAAKAEIMERMKAEGHEIGCHGYAHLNGWKSWPWRILADVEQGYGALARWTPRNGLFRPPYGKLSFPAYWALLRRGARLAWWTTDSGDTGARLPERESVASAVARAGGGVV